MKLAATILALLATGCITDAATDAPDAMDQAASALPFAGEGRIYLPPSNGNDRVESLIAFPVNASGMSLVADLALGSNYGPLDAPVTIADVRVELRAPDGTVLADGALGAQNARAHLEASAATSGEHALAILSYGGSDEEANGDHVDWHLDAALS